MSAPQQIKVGQWWRSRDWRETDVVVTVLSVDGDGLYDNGFATIQRPVRQTRIRTSTLRKRYKLVRIGGSS